MALQREQSDITDIIGKFGPWQCKIFGVVFFVAMLVAFQHMAVPFFAPKLDFWCVDQHQQDNVSFTSDWSPILNNNNSARDPCRTAVVTSEGSVLNQTTACTAWEYDHSLYSATITEEWNLVCSDSWKVSLAQSSYMIGNLVAAVGLTQLSDRFGRRPMILSSAVLLLVAGIICAFSPSFVIFAVSRFVLALGTTGLFLNDFVILMEVVGPEYRPTLGVALELGWATGYVLLPGIAYLLHNWVYIQLAITIPVASLAVLWWVMPESPRWLIANGKLDLAEEVALKAARANGKEVSNLPAMVRKLCDAAEKEKDHGSEKRATIFDLMKSPNLRKNTLVIFFNWFVNAFIFYGLSLNTNELEGNPFLNFALSGLVEFPAYLIAILILRRLGRRIPQMSFMVVGGLACVATIPVPNHLMWLRITLAMIGKFCITASYAVIYVYSAEVYPTVVRTVAMGSSSFFSKIGSIIAPFTRELSQLTDPSVPFCLYGGLSIASGLLVLMLPETSNRELPDTIHQAENFHLTVDKPVNGNSQEIPLNEKSYTMAENSEC